MDQFDTKICDAEFGKICVPGLSLFQTLISDHLDTKYRCDLHIKH